MSKSKSLNDKPRIIVDEFFRERLPEDNHYGGARAHELDDFWAWLFAATLSKIFTVLIAEDRSTKEKLATVVDVANRMADFVYLDQEDGYVSNLGAAYAAFKRRRLDAPISLDEPLEQKMPSAELRKLLAVRADDIKKPGNSALDWDLDTSR
jgi:hypothetical protein